MVKRVFFSFHYGNDNWRASQIRNIGMMDGNPVASDNDWESIKSRGDAAIRNWINRQMEGRSTAVVLIGSQTYGRKWINYEIKQGWTSGKALLGVYVHQLKNRLGHTDVQGNNPFADFNISGVGLDRIVPLLNVGNIDSKTAYNRIAANLPNFIEAAIDIRRKY